jgi:uncharacterized membrane protein
MLTFAKWRKARARGDSPAASASDLPSLIAINDAETALVVLIPFLAALMARGAWLF